MRAASLLLVLACCRHQPPEEVSSAHASEPIAASAPEPLTMRVDAGFAQLVLDHRAGQAGLEQALLDHPALAAIVEHQRLSGNPAPDPAGILEHILDSDLDLACARSVLDHWRGRDAELVAIAMAAMHHLPADTVPGEVLYLELGYEIGFVAPPAFALNVGHPHFCEDPAELAYYALHEHHHLGFLQWLSWPDLSSLDTREELLDLIRFATWMEGSAVHAAYDARQRAGALGSDQDYAIYLDPDEAARVGQRYEDVVAIAGALDPVNAAGLEFILGPLSSGERLWYRYGALLAWQLEQAEGRHGLRRRILSGEGLPGLP